MPRRIATWNPTRGIWEDPHGAMDLLSEHSEPFSATWPTSGTTRSGSAFERPMPALRTGASASSSSRSLPTPTAADGDRTSAAYERGNPTLLGALLPTPVTTDAEQTRRRTTTASASHSGTTLTDALLPTPAARLATSGVDTTNASRDHGAGGGAPDLTTVVVLLPTPSAMMANDAEDPDEWWDRWEYHAHRTDQRPTQAEMPLAISAKLLARGDHSRLRFAAGSASSDE